MSLRDSEFLSIILQKDKIVYSEKSVKKLHSLNIDVQQLLSTAKTKTDFEINSYTFKVNKTMVDTDTIVYNLVFKEKSNLEKLATIGSMTSGILHDLNNPLNYIISSLEVLKMDLIEEGDEEKLTFLKNIEDGALLINDITNGLLALCKQEQLKRKNVNLVDLVNKTLSFSNSLLRKNNIEYDVIVDGSKDDYNYEAYDTQLIQVFFNLIKNSHDALIDKSNFDKWINIQISQDEGNFILNFVDGGNGIPKEIENKIFKQFFTTKETDKGTGIGLNFCQELILKHNGSIGVDSDNKNTCFYIKLPKIILEKV